jgi:hypothetical protein
VTTLVASYINAIIEVKGVSAGSSRSNVPGATNTAGSQVASPTATTPGQDTYLVGSSNATVSPWLIETSQAIGATPVPASYLNNNNNRPIMNGLGGSIMSSYGNAGAANANAATTGSPGAFATSPHSPSIVVSKLRKLDSYERLG